MSLNFVDRVPTYPNKYKVTREDGTTEYLTLERADEPTVIGTPLNAATFNEAFGDTKKIVTDAINDVFENTEKIVNDAIARTMVRASATLTAAGWVGSTAPYTQTVTVADVLSDDHPHVGVACSTDLDAAKAQKEAWALVDDIDSGDGTITFTCFEEKPTVDIPINIEVNR